ncbi:hatching enzyme 1.2-like isoform X2 [Lepisosteus oculatus]|uniref:Metalloendopeptidase n=1 Tax=Lepisosteus oculatus TaxID=7918 RepID=W5MT88_LEPOC|nr:PREDICTED: low choriolytic enzyme-like isoform X1 [Lepisosteus oculatus]
MNSTMIFILLGLTAYACAFPIQNASDIIEETKRFKRSFSEELLSQDEMTAMDKIMEANEYQAAPPMPGMSFREGDIAVSKGQRSMSCFARSCLWPKSVDGYVYVPYNMSSDYNEIDRMIIESGMESISNSTCIRFVPWTHQRNYLNIQPMSGCWSFLGVHGGAQTLSLQNPGCMWAGVATHELMHALGFLHEQSRADRDKYITILWGNIWKDRVSNFERYKTNNMDSPYDYSSIMHFGKYAYSEDGDPTILAKSNPAIQIGQRFGPSAVDIMKINKLYKCDKDL